MRVRRFLFSPLAIILMALWVGAWVRQPPPQAAGRHQAPRASVHSPLLLKVTLGLGDSKPTEWNGVARLDKGSFRDIQGWQFNPPEKVHLETASWQVATKTPNRDTSQITASLYNQPRIDYGGSPTRAVGLWMEVDAPDDAILLVNTIQGSFEIRLDEIPAQGSTTRLGKRVRIERAVPSSRVSTTSTHDDYPSLAFDSNRALHAAWIGYQDGSDRIFHSVRQSSVGSGDWSDAREVGPTPRILGSTTMAADGEGNVWLVYNALENGQFDLWARQLAPTLGHARRLTQNAGNDIHPRAHSDEAGNLWLVWQGLRSGNSDIFLMKGWDRGNEEIRVTDHPTNDWDPSLSVDSGGNAVVVWDSYRNGDYDVYLRSVSSHGKLGAVEPVSATPNYEVHATAAFDSEDQLWVAWEESAAKLGQRLRAREQQQRNHASHLPTGWPQDSSREPMASPAEF